MAANPSVRVRLIPELCAALDRLVMTHRANRQEVIRRLIAEADSEPVHRAIVEMGVSKTEAREFLGVRR
jgi:hypothetical protein